MTPNWAKIWVSYVSTCMQILVEIRIFFEDDAEATAATVPDITSGVLIRQVLRSFRDRAVRPKWNRENKVCLCLGVSNRTDEPKITNKHIIEFLNSLPRQLNNLGHI